MTNLFLAPHCDDETLFGAFTLLKHKPVVMICLGSGYERLKETAQATEILGCRYETSGLEEGDSLGPLRESLIWMDPDVVFAPMPVAGGNGDHNAIGQLAGSMWPDRTTFYTTYTDRGKQTGKTMVEYEPEWIGLKHQALACYHSQFEQPGRAVHFLRDQTEFYA